jgi:hypothetical protein
MNTTGVTVTMPLEEFKRLEQVEEYLKQAQYDFTTALIAINLVATRGMSEAADELHKTRKARLERTQEGKIIIKYIK